MVPVVWRDRDGNIVERGMMSVVPECDASVEFVPRTRCLCGKARYATEGEARRAVKRMRVRGTDRRHEGVLHPYMCPERKGIWHVGHTDE
jgi:hypothetical protein